MRLDLRTRVLSIAALQLVAVAVVLFVFYYFEAKDKVTQQYVEKARSVILTAESTREEMGKKWDQGIFTAAELKKWADEKQLGKVLSAVPVVTAWQAAMAKAKEGGFEFRVPKFQARNPQNEPDAFEARVLNMMHEQSLAEYYEIDKERNAIRYFRPVKLTQDCMLCHGDPKMSAEYWGNDQGLDPTGTRMENWKVGEIHGAFEIVQSLDEADAQIAASMRKAGLMVAVLIIAGSGLFFVILTRKVIRPMNAVVCSMREGAEQVDDASQQVSSAAQQVAEGATEQASSLEETSAALQELSSKTRDNADKSEQANRIADQAREAARNSDQVMAQLTTAMDGIDSSSSQISKIIKVIEEIAFQTNLLALNAAVEAARAGDHGKGFAVVAGEVRNLALRAAQAARETTTLIDASVQNAKQGTAVASAVGESLTTISSDVARIADLLDAINRGSREQASGVEQINTAVSQMNGVTQQNAAGAEESAAASEELSAQAASLMSMVDHLAGMVNGESGSRQSSKAEGRSTGSASMTDATRARPNGSAPRQTGSARTGATFEQHAFSGEASLSDF
ncbi:MAG: DUF3365 domain-containing protein [Phycisphaerae bacterium]|nr:DUF3365 domain-containing protein [Phycisphaerae bacterium]